MGDIEIVCCMCGDVGFPDKIFRCINCHNRFQHSYCSNYYNESSDLPEVCDWCKAEETRSSKHGAGGSSKRPGGHSGDKIKQEGSSEKGKSPTGGPSPRTGARRYKLLKDVMC